MVGGACGSLAPTGGANGGEVEDFVLEFRPTAVTLSDFSANGNSSAGLWLALPVTLLSVFIGYTARTSYGADFFIVLFTTAVITSTIVGWLTSKEGKQPG